MYGASLPDLTTARHADLLREAERARRVAAARRNDVSAPPARRWRRLAALRDRRPALRRTGRPVRQELGTPC